MNGPLLDAVNWLQQLMLGTMATTISVLAVAVVGMLMLSGRMPVRRSSTVVLGCFILFGSTTIANGLLAAIDGKTETIADQPSPPPPTPIPYTPTTPPPVPYDPYAGAAVPQ